MDGTQLFQNIRSRRCLTARGSGEPATVVTTCDFDAGARWADQHWYA